MRSVCQSLALFLLVCIGCGGGSPAEPAGSARQGITVTDSGWLEQGGLQLALNNVDFNGSSFAFAGEVATFTPSSTLSTRIWQDPHGSNHALKFNLKPVTYDPGSVLPKVTVSVTSVTLDTKDFTFQFGADALNVDTAISGALHVHTSWPWPDADLKVDRMEVHTALKFDTTAERLVATVSVDLQKHVENCGAFGWCDIIVQHNLPDMRDLIAGLIRDGLNERLADPAVTQGLYGVLASAWNSNHQADYGGGPPWAVVPGTVKISSTPEAPLNGGFRFGVRRSFAPSVTPDCQVVGATESVVFYCQPYPTQHSSGTATETAPALHGQYLDGSTWRDLGAIAPVYGAVSLTPGSYELRIQWKDADGAGPWLYFSKTTSAPHEACDAQCFGLCDTTTYYGCICPACKDVCPFCAPPAELVFDFYGACTCQYP